MQWRSVSAESAQYVHCSISNKYCRAIYLRCPRLNPFSRHVWERSWFEPRRMACGWNSTRLLGDHLGIVAEVVGVPDGGDRVACH